MYSDFGWPVRPERIAAMILRVSAGFDWSSLTIQEYGFTVTTHDGKEHLFQVHKGAGSWRWSVYATTDQTILEEMGAAEPAD